VVQWFAKIAPKPSGDFMFTEIEKQQLLRPNSPDLSGVRARELVAEDPCLALKVLQRQGTFTRTGELLVNYFGGRARMLQYAQDHPECGADMGILQQV
jgi:hypothetical protein